MKKLEQISYAKTVYGQEEISAVVKCLSESTQMGNYSRKFESKIAKIFDKNPSKYIEEIKNVIVCPVCLAEKNIAHTTGVKYKNTVIPFCRCPHCISTFEEKPEYYLDRLMGKIEYEGLFNNLCC